MCVSIKVILVYHHFSHQLRVFIILQNSYTFPIKLHQEPCKILLSSYKSMHIAHKYKNNRPTTSLCFYIIFAIIKSIHFCVYRNCTISYNITHSCNCSFFDGQKPEESYTIFFSLSLCRLYCV